jgi:hypothetical protein
VAPQFLAEVFAVFRYALFAANGACRDGEHIDRAEDEGFGPRPAEIRDGIEQLGSVQPRPIRLPNKGTRLTVIYVPPMSGSAICVWNAVMPTNCTVLVG